MGENSSQAKSNRSGVTVPTDPHIRFCWGGRTYMLPNSVVLGVGVLGNPVRLPGAPSHVLGLTLWNGRILPVLSPADGDHYDSGATPRLLFVRQQSREAALVVQAIEDSTAHDSRIALFSFEAVLQGAATFPDDRGDHGK